MSGDGIVSEVSIRVANELIPKSPPTQNSVCVMPILVEGERKDQDNYAHVESSSRSNVNEVLTILGSTCNTTEPTACGVLEE